MEEIAKLKLKILEVLNALETVKNNKQRERQYNSAENVCSTPFFGCEEPSDRAKYKTDCRENLAVPPDHGKKHRGKYSGAQGADNVGRTKKQGDAKSENTGQDISPKAHLREDLKHRTKY